MDYRPCVNSVVAEQSYLLGVFRGNKNNKNSAVLKIVFWYNNFQCFASKMPWEATWGVFLEWWEEERKLREVEWDDSEDKLCRRDLVTLSEVIWDTEKSVKGWKLREREEVQLKLLESAISRTFSKFTGKRWLQSNSSRRKNVGNLLLSSFQTVRGFINLSFDSKVFNSHARTIQKFQIFSEPVT
jgi:hypothetical protein